MKRKHYSHAKFLRGAIAYCDQWMKVIAVYDDRDVLRSVIADNGDGGATILFRGDDYCVIEEIEEVEFGLTSKNMEICFDIFCILHDVDLPRYTPTGRRKSISVIDIFPHYYDESSRHSRFHMISEQEEISNAREKISKALEIAAPYFGSCNRISINYANDNAWRDDGGYDDWDYS